jgi:DNA repair protein RadC
MQVNDVSGNYPTNTARVKTQTLENNLAAILRSRPAARKLMQQIVGNAICHDAAALGRILRVHLMQPAHLSLTQSQIQALQGTIGLAQQMYVPIAPNQIKIDDPAIAGAWLTQAIGWKSVESFAVLVLNVKHEVIACEVVTIGTVTETLAHPREIFGTVIRLNGCRMIVGHNHPSGSLEPSPEDIMLTRQLLKAATVMGIPLLDHLIVTQGSYRSLRENTGLWQEIPQD